jgi:hypothetical protein
VHSVGVQRQYTGTAGRIENAQVAVCRNTTTRELAYLRCYSPRPVPLSTLVRVAGQH